MTIARDNPTRSIAYGIRQTPWPATLNISPCAACTSFPSGYASRLAIVMTAGVSVSSPSSLPWPVVRHRQGNSLARTAFTRSAIRGMRRIVTMVPTVDVWHGGGASNAPGTANLNHKHPAATGSFLMQGTALYPPGDVRLDNQAAPRIEGRQSE